MANASAVGTSKTVQIWASRNGNALMLRLSINVPASVANALTLLMTLAAQQSQAHLVISAGLSGKRLVQAYRKIRSVVPRLMAVQTTTAPPPFAVTTNGILPSLDEAIVRLAGVIVMVWQKFGVNPQPTIEYIQFDDEIVVGSPQPQPTNTAGSQEEPGLEPDNLITGLMASGVNLAALAIGAAVSEVAEGVTAVAVGSEVAANVLDAAYDFVKEQFTDLATELAADPQSSNQLPTLSPVTIGPITGIPLDNDPPDNTPDETDNQDNQDNAGGPDQPDKDVDGVLLE